MMWYISNPHLGNGNNAKNKELHNYVQRFRCLLVKDEATFNAIINDIKDVVSQLNETYPRTKPLAVQYLRGCGYNEILTCAPSQRRSDSDEVFTLSFSPINQVWEVMSDGSFAIWKEEEK